MKKIEEMDAADVLDPATFQELFDIEDLADHQKMQTALFLRAKEMRLGTTWNSMYKSWQKNRSKKNEMVQIQQTSMITDFSPDKNGKSYPSMTCGNWIANDSGIIAQNVGESSVLVCGHPILPVKLFCNKETDTEMVTLAYKRRDVWKEITVPKVDIASSRGILKLAKYGIYVIEPTAKLLVKYLADVEYFNQDIITLQESTSKFGWHNNLFVPYTSKLEFDARNDFKRLYDSLSEHGDYSVWVMEAKKLRESAEIVPRLALAISFGSAIVKKLNGMCSIFDFFGQAGCGKSVTEYVSASVWGDPEIGSYIQTFRTTFAAIEAIGECLNHLPYIIDDSNNSTLKEGDFQELIYNLCAGAGKGRSNERMTIENVKTWQNFTIVNGERPLSSIAGSSTGGSLTRVIEIECGDHIYNDPKHVAFVFKQNYGFAGRIFIEQLQEKADWEKLRERRQEIEDLLTTNETVQKQTLAMSIVLLADELVTEYIFRDGRNLQPEEVKHLLTKKSEISDGNRAYEYIKEMFYANQSRWDGTANEQWGMFHSDIGGIHGGLDDYCFWYPNRLKEELAKHGLNIRTFRMWADKRGLLLINEPNRGTYKVRSGRFVGIKIENVFVDDDDFVQQDEFSTPFS